MQCQYYGHRRSKLTCIGLYAICLGFLGGLQAGMIYAIRPSYRKGNDAGVEFIGICSTVIISVALLPQYYEIYKHREVVGISVLFMTIDMLGGVCNDLSLAFKSQFNVIGGVSYSLVAVMDAGIVLLALILNPIAARRRRRDAAVPTFSEHPCPETPGSNLELRPTNPRAGDEEAGEREVLQAVPRTAHRA